MLVSLGSSVDSWRAELPEERRGFNDILWDVEDVALSGIIFRASLVAVSLLKTVASRSPRCIILAIPLLDSAT